MKKYELTIVLDGKVSAAKKKAVLGKIAKLIEAFQGKVVKSDEWGIKELAYRMGKSTTGFFVYYQLELEGGQAKGLADKLRLEEDLIRHLLVKWQEA